MFKHKKYAFVFIVISLPMAFIMPYGWIKKENHPIHELVKQGITGERTELGDEKTTSSFTASLDSLQQLINITKQYKKEGYVPIELVAFLDSNYIAKKLIPFKFCLIPDSNIISKSYLKKNEGLATRAKAEAPWKHLISSEVFEEYIFPYKLDHEIADNWREELFNFNRTLISSNPQFNNPDSLYRYHMQNTYYSLKSENSINQFYPVEKNYTWLNISQEGDCSDRCRYVIYHLRAAGVPATYDYIPNWGNRPKSRHAYVGLAHKRQQINSLLENRNDTGNMIENLNAANVAKSRNFFEKGEVPDGLTVQYEKTIPKVYRQTWSDQPSMQKIMKDIQPGQLYDKLLKPNMLDVTNQYLLTAHVNIWHNPFDDWDIAYLATFDITGWTPVAFATFNWFGMAKFRNMGKNILYLPMVCKNQKLLPIGRPFILNNEGNKEEFVGNQQEKTTMKLIRKFPLFSYTASHVVDLKGCVISGSNDYHFQVQEQLAVIDHYPFFMEKVKINSTNQYRYFKVESPEGKKIRLAYLACFSDSSGMAVKHNDIRYLNGELTGQSLNLFDEDLNTYTVGRTLHMDLGSPKQISEIQLCPRSDTNYIIPGNRYELFYWDNGWKSAGQTTATDYFLEYTDIPSGTIYWLRCLTEGKEERIFTYKNGKQIWW